jgi:hypothetical protein
VEKHLKTSEFRSIHQIIYWLIFFFVGILIYPEYSDAQKDKNLSTYKMEEIIVVGESLRSLERRANEAEDLKFEIFNSLNSTDEFDITCERVEQTGSIITRRVCDVGFMKKARAEDARLLLDDMRDAGAQNPGSSFYPPGFQPLLLRSNDQLAGEFAHKAEALKKEMVELGGKHPSLAKAMIDAYELKQRYILEQREKFKDSIMIGHPEPVEYFGDELKWLNIAFLAHYSGMMEEEIWRYWDRRLRSVIHQEPYRSIWLSSDIKTYSFKFIGYVTAILWG